MAYWLSRFVDTPAYGVVPEVARDQGALDGQMSVWWDMSKNPGDVAGVALVATPGFRYAWHNPPRVYVLGESLDDQVYAETGVAVKDAFNLDWPASSWRKTGCAVSRTQDRIDLGTTTLTVGDTVGVDASTAAGLANRPYWVAQVISGRYIKVSTTQGGTVVDVTSNGTCTVYQTLPVRRAIRWLSRNAPGWWRQPPIDYDASITVAIGSESWTFNQDDEPVHFSDPDPGGDIPPIGPPDGWDT